MAQNLYVIGRTVYVTLFAEKISTVFPPVYIPYDPDTLFLELTDPTGSSSMMQYGIEPSLYKSTETGKTVGYFYAVLRPNIENLWRYKWIDPDATHPTLTEGSFRMRNPRS